MSMDLACHLAEHEYCSTKGWDEEKDEPADCQCACHDMKEGE